MTAKSLAHDGISEYLEQDRIVTDKTSYATVYAIGSLMNFAIKPLSSKSVYSQDDIENLIADFFVGHTDVITLRQFQTMFPKINPNFFNVIQSNLLLVQRIMEGAHIDKINIVSTISTDPMALKKPVDIYPSGETVNNIWYFI